jgi:hypothetical protein
MSIHRSVFWKSSQIRIKLETMKITEKDGKAEKEKRLGKL